MEPRLTLLLDVDNTLLDNEAAKAAIAAQLRDLLGEPEANRFWEVYEAVRHAEGMVNIPLALARFDAETGLSAAATDALPPSPPERSGTPFAPSRRFALADLWMGFPYDRYLFPGALAAIAHLRRLGRVAILSDGDPTFQPSKIWRAGLDAAVDGYVLVFDHKEEHLAEVTAAFPADHYVLIDDKPDILAEIGRRLGEAVTTVLVRQGRYAASAPPGRVPGIDLTVRTIGEVSSLDAAAFGWAGGPLASDETSARRRGSRRA